MWQPSDDPNISPFRRRLEIAGNRLEELAERSSPSAAVEIKREIVAVREASRLIEGQPCDQCQGVDSALRRTLGARRRCAWCGGTGDL